MTDRYMLTELFDHVQKLRVLQKGFFAEKTDPAKRKMWLQAAQKEEAKTDALMIEIKKVFDSQKNG